jgi:hypothetical protein
MGIMDHRCARMRQPERGWLYILSENFDTVAESRHRLEHFSADVRKAIADILRRWAVQYPHRRDLLAPITPTLSARVFELSGPDGNCVALYLEAVTERA